MPEINPACDLGDWQIADVTGVAYAALDVARSAKKKARSAHVRINTMRADVEQLRLDFDQIKTQKTGSLRCMIAKCLTPTLHIGPTDAPLNTSIDASLSPQIYTPTSIPINNSINNQIENPINNPSDNQIDNPINTSPQSTDTMAPPCGVTALYQQFLKRCHPAPRIPCSTACLQRRSCSCMIVT